MNGPFATRAPTHATVAWSCVLQAGLRRASALLPRPTSSGDVVTMEAGEAKAARVAAAERDQPSLVKERSVQRRRRRLMLVHQQFQMV